MNLFQKIMSWFGCQYVILVMHDNDMPIKRAYQVGGKWYAAPYCAETRSELLAGGKIFGQSYVVSWRPVTTKMFNLFKEPEEKELFIR